MSLRSEDWSSYNKLLVTNEVLVHNVRMHSNAGWYIGVIEFYNSEEIGPYSRESGYYPNEESLKCDYPNSLSIEDAFKKPKRFKNNQL